MSERLNGNEAYICDKVAEMYNECRENKDLYEENDGTLSVTVDGLEWEIDYWPEFTQKNRATLVLSFADNGGRAVYEARKGAGIAVLEKVTRFNENKVLVPTVESVPVKDPSVAEILYEVISTAHEFYS